MHNYLTIKSHVNDYKLNVVKNLRINLKNEIGKNDFLIIDKNVLKNYLFIKKYINKKKIIIINCSEKSKNFENLSKIIRNLLKLSIKKDNRIIAIGGGILQDVCSFISSILFRGINWVYYPTTLLSQCDSCIGSKTSINFDTFKNQIGSFYPPSKIYIYFDFLNSLMKKDIDSGLGEMSHYLIIDSRKSFFKLKNFFLYKKKYNKKLEELIRISLRIKKKFIEIDEFDQNERNILNYGHTFGHAIESASNYKVPHGVAVSYGIDVANFFSVNYGFLSNKTRIDIKNTLKNLWTDYNIKNINIKKILLAIKNDKKNNKKFINLILCSDYGKVFKYKVFINKKFVNLLINYFNKI